MYQASNFGQLVTGYNEFTSALENYSGATVYNGDFALMDMIDFMAEIAEIPGLVIISTETQLPCNKLFKTFYPSGRGYDLVCQNGVIVQVGLPNYFYIHKGKKGITEPHLVVCFGPWDEKRGCYQKKDWSAFQLEGDICVRAREYEDKNAVCLQSENFNDTEVILQMNRSFYVTIAPKLAMVTELYEPQIFGTCSADNWQKPNVDGEEIRGENASEYQNENNNEFDLALAGFKKLDRYGFSLPRLEILQILKQLMKFEEVFDVKFDFFNVGSKNVPPIVDVWIDEEHVELITDNGERINIGTPDCLHVDELDEETQKYKISVGFFI